jgi:hypothetical protein
MSLYNCSSASLLPVNNTYTFPPGTPTDSIWLSSDSTAVCGAVALNVIKLITVTFANISGEEFGYTIFYNTTSVATLISNVVNGTIQYSQLSYTVQISGINFLLTSDGQVGITDATSGTYVATYTFAPAAGLAFAINLTVAQNNTVSGSGVLSDPSTSLSSTNSNTVMNSNAMIKSNVMNALSKVSNKSSKCNMCKTNTCNDCQMFITPGCNSVNVPIINLIALLSIGGADIAQAQFIICDEFTYYKEEPLPHDDRCVIAYIKPCQLKETKFLRCCPFMVSVVKGKGATLYDKLLSIYMKAASSIGTDFFTFYYRVVLYGMSKYILSRILYGKFDIDFLLNKYNKKFLEDLGHSRFCSFIAVFEDCTSVVFGYQKYFRFDKHHKSSSSK